jgi:uncharacterized protein YkwD
MSWLSRFLEKIGIVIRPAPPKPPDPVKPPADTGIEIHDLHNAERARAGVPPLTIDRRLSEAAHRHAQWMADTGRLSHTGANGSSFFDRITREGYVASTGGENIAQGYRNPREVVAGWMSSSGHRANILNRNFREVGYGVSGAYWCVVFASPAGGNRISESAESFPSPLTMMG